MQTLPVRNFEENALEIPKVLKLHTAEGASGSSRGNQKHGYGSSLNVEKKWKTKGSFVELLI